MYNILLDEYLYITKVINLRGSKYMTGENQEVLAKVEEKKEELNEEKGLLKYLNKKLVKRIALIVGVFIFSLMLGAGGVVLVWGSENIPVWNPKGLDPQLTTFIYDKNKSIVAELHARENRVYVTSKQVPQELKDAFIATEDNRFYEHNGVDMRAIARALVVNFKGGRAEEGASTISQQLIKNTFLTPEKTIKRKFQEVYLSIRLEKEFSKEEILEMYVNRIYFGHGAYGVEAAAKTFFGKHVKDLTLSESALLAGIPRRPSTYDPYRHKKEAELRRNTVLDLMLKYRYIDNDTAQRAKKEPIKLSQLKEPTYKYPFFVDHVIEEAKEKNIINEEQIYQGGLRIYTSLDPRAQKITQAAFANPNNFPRGRRDQQVQGSMVIMDYRTGEIKAIVGGRKHEARLGYNRATQLSRQPGSTFKPVVVYAPALEKGYSSRTVLVDSPVTFGKYSPKNADGRYRGSISMEEALKNSINIYAVKMLNKIGIGEGYEFAQKMGFDLVRSDYGYPLALGGLTNGTSPLKMASAFGTFADSGQQVQAHVINKITDSKGTALYEAEPRPKKIMKPANAIVLTQMLKEAVDHGTGTNARMNRPVAGKTGTTQLPFKGASGHKDVWFVGYTPELVAAVWMGYDHTDRRHYLNTYGGDYPAGMFRKVMSKVLAGQKVTKFKSINEKVRVRVCTISGLVASKRCPYRIERFIKGSGPTKYCSGNHKEYWSYKKKPKDEKKVKNNIPYKEDKNKNHGKKNDGIGNGGENNNKGNDGIIIDEGNSSEGDKQNNNDHDEQIDLNNKGLPLVKNKSNGKGNGRK